jgi:hypothetical protein
MLHDTYHVKRMSRQSWSRRSGAVLAVLAAAVACAGCAASGHPTSAAQATKATFRNDFVAFSYPGAWKTLQFQITGTLHFDPMLYLSTQPGHNPCRQSGSATTCGWPVDRLRPNSVLVAWENKGWPGWTLTSQPGTSLRVGGRPARQQVVRPGACGAIGADETVTVEVARPVSSSWTAVTACLRGPNLAAQEKEVARVLASTRFLKP